VWEPCGRRGRYNVERLIAKHGADMRLPDLLTIVADCPKARSFSIYVPMQSAVCALLLALNISREPPALPARPRRELQRRDLAARRDRGADALRTLPIAPLFG
jgi:hypothetical protein